MRQTFLPRYLAPGVAGAVDLAPSTEGANNNGWDINCQ